MKITKICTSCLRELQVSAFRKQSGTKDGYQYECKLCTSGRAKERYENKREEVLDKNKEWQENNPDKHRAAALKYYHSPTARMSRSLNKRLTELLGDKRDSFLHLVGTSPSALMVHLSGLLVNDLTIDDYGIKWVIAFIQPIDLAQIDDEGHQRKIFNWQNLTVKKVTSSRAQDFAV